MHAHIYIWLFHLFRFAVKFMFINFFFGEGLCLLTCLPLMFASLSNNVTCIYSQVYALNIFCSSSNFHFHESACSYDSEVYNYISYCGKSLNVLLYLSQFILTLL